MDEQANESNSTILIRAESIQKKLAETENEAKTKPAALLAIGGALNGALFNLDGSEVSAGRSYKNTIHLEFPGVSRFHFKLCKINSVWCIQDTNSKNGTYVNNNRIHNPTKLNKGDIIKVLNIAFKYLPQGDSERLAYDRLNHIVNTDGHTGCFNKTYFNERLQENFTTARLIHQALSLIIFDLDHFKHVNDQYGHDAGDYVLKEIADIVRINGVREQDVFARYGGEEFVILLPQTSIKQAMDIAEKIRAIIAQHPFDYENTSLSVTASFGVADYNKDIISATELFKRADKAAYEAKKNGRNQVRVLDE